MSIPDPIVLLDARARYVHPAFQMTRASTKTVFDATGKLVTVPVNAIGWDHDPATGQARGYLTEPSATNLLLHSNDLSDSAWSKFQSSITPSAITGPDGNGMAKLVEDTSSSTHSVFQSTTISDGATVIYQLIAKAGERQSVRVQIRNESSPVTNLAEIDVSLIDGTISNANEVGTCELIDYDAKHIGGGFYFIWLAATIGSGNTSARVQVQLIDGNGNTNYTGDGTSGLYLGYCQAEEAHARMDSPAPTSYIETGSATATRAGGQLVLRNIHTTSWWNPNGGTILLDWYRKSAMRNGMHWAIADSFWLRESGDAGVVQLQVGGGVSDTVQLLPSSQFDIEARHLAAVAWDAEDFSASANGRPVVTGNMTGSPSGHFRVGWYDLAWSNPPHANFARLVYYPQRISNADLQSLTAIQE